jgi:hypothetical protein
MAPITIRLSASDPTRTGIVQRAGRVLVMSVTTAVTA